MKATLFWHNASHKKVIPNGPKAELEATIEPKNIYEEFLTS